MARSSEREEGRRRAARSSIIGISGRKISGVSVLKTEMFRITEMVLTCATCARDVQVWHVALCIKAHFCSCCNCSDELHWCGVQASDL